MRLAKVGSRHRWHLQSDRTTSNALPSDRAKSSALPGAQATSSTLPGDRPTSSTLHGQGVTAYQIVSLIITVLLTGTVHLKTYNRAVELGPCNMSDLQLHGFGGELRESQSAAGPEPAARPSPGQAPTKRDTVLDTLPVGMFNPSIIVHEGEAWAVVREQYIMPNNRWALGRNHMVQLNLTRWSVQSIHMFDPWQNVHELGVPCKRKMPHTTIDVWGPDDTKLFVWPGNGVWALTAGRPRIERCVGACCNCTQLVFQQWLVQVARESEPLDPTHFGKSLQPVPPYDYPGWKLTFASDTGSQVLVSRDHSHACGRSTADSLAAKHGNKDWRRLWRAAPLPITLADSVAVYGNRTDVEEKNWMLFSIGNNLYFTYELAPAHRVYLVHPNGQAEPVSDTNSSSVFAPLGVRYQNIHGGPSIVHVTNKHLQAAGLPDDEYLLGVVHFHKRVYYAPDPLYQHFLIKIEPRPPFRILQLSAELILQFVDKTWFKQQVAFVSGLQVAMLKPREGETLAAPRRRSAAKHFNGTDLPDLLSGNDGLEPHVLFSYGTADYMSRVLVLPLVEVEQLFSSASWNSNSSKQQLQQGVVANPDLPSLDRSSAQAAKARTPAPPNLSTVLQRHKHGAAVLYWHLKQCGGDHMCSALQRANKKLLSCWALLPASNAPEDAEQGCHCSGPEHASLSSFGQEQLQSFIHKHNWVDAFFDGSGMPRDPYYGSKAVHVAVLRDPVTRYLAHIVHEGNKHNVPHFRPKLNLGQVIQQRAHEWHWLVPDNYMTRFLLGHWALQDHGYLSRPVTPGMFEQALANLQRMDVVLVLEEAHTPEVGALLTALGLSPFGMDSAVRSELTNMYNVTGAILEQVVSWHTYDMQLYSYARRRHAELLQEWKKVK